MEYKEFARKKDYLVCVDSDGCAMDTMDIKHFRCFGPCMVEEWGLEEWRDDILYRWNQVNLYSMTRGINRFKALAILLSEIDKSCKKIPGTEEFIKWTEVSDELSNAELSRVLEKSGSSCLKKALHWSNEVNNRINEISEWDKIPFAGVKEGLAFAHEYADIAIVSSANPDAVSTEWEKHGLMKCVDLLMAQNAGSKTFCISKLLEYGYEPDHVMMIGDAPGDLSAAEKNRVRFYPVLVSHESDSWNGIKEALDRLINGTFDNSYQKQLINAFEHNLLN
ncbi:MAG: HAD family hydrolase [Hungatella sp.]|nr:HAD family hydrolase [Hungatella sp.]